MHQIVILIQIPSVVPHHSDFSESSNRIGLAILERLLEEVLARKGITAEKAGRSGKMDDGMIIIPVSDWKPAMRIVAEVLGEIRLGQCTALGWYDPAEMIFRTARQHPRGEFDFEKEAIRLAKLDEGFQRAAQGVIDAWKRREELGGESGQGGVQ